MSRDDSPEQNPYTLSMRTTPHWQTSSMVDKILRERIVDGRLAPQSWVGSTDQDTLEKRALAFATAVKGLGAAHETGRNVLDASLGLWPVRAAQPQDEDASDLRPRINPEVDVRRHREAYGSSA
jgi:hypothetical protein